MTRRYKSEEELFQERIEADRARRLKEGVVPVQRWETSDGKLHSNEEKAGRHQQFLHMAAHLAELGAEGAARRSPYDLVMSLLEHFDITPKVSK